MIVKHRRGTTKEWQEVDLIPEEGELVIEECLDGSWKCKIGTGYTKFSKLPYIDEQTRLTLLQEIAATKAELEDRLSTLKNDMSSNIATVEQQLTEDITLKCAALTTEIKDKNAATASEIKKDFNETVKALRKEITELGDSIADSSNQTQTELAASIAEVSKELSDTKTQISSAIAAEADSRDKEVKVLQQTITNTVSGLTQDIQKAAEDLSKQLFDHVDTVTEKTAANIEDLETRVKSDFVVIDTKIAEQANTFAAEVSKVDAKLDTMAASFSTQVSTLSDKVDSELATQINTVESRLAEVTAEQATKLNEIDQQFQAELSQVTKKHQEDVASLHTEIETAVSDFETQLDSLNTLFAELEKLEKAVEAEALARNEADTALREAINKSKESTTKQIQDASEQLVNQFNTRIIETDSKLTTAVEGLNSKITEESNTFEQKLQEQAATYDSKLQESTKSTLETTDAKISLAKTQLQWQIDNNSAKQTTAINDLRDATDTAFTTVDARITNVNKLCTDLATADTALEALISALDNQSKEADTELLKQIKQLRETINDVNSFAQDIVDRLDTAEDKLLGNIDDLFTGLDTAIEDFNTHITNTEVTFDQKLTDAIAETNLALLENIETLRSTTNLKFIDVQNNINTVDTALKTFKSETGVNFVEVGNQISQNRVEVNRSLNEVSDQLDVVNEHIAETDKKLEAQAKRVSRLMALPDGSTTADAELVDIRTGYNNIDYETAGEAVRAIGYDLDALKASLPSYIPSNAVDGLFYENNQLWLTSKDELVGDPVTITGGGGGGGGSISTVKVTNNLPSASFTISKGGEAWIDFTYTSFENEVPTGDGTCSIIINDKKIEAISGGIQHGVAKRLNVAEYLKNGSNSVKVVCADQYGASRSLVYTITQIELRIESTFNSAQIFDDTITFRYKVFGQIEKTVHILVDGTEVSTKKLGSNVSGNELTLVISKQAHGSHKLIAYVDATVSGNTVTSNTLEYEIVCVDTNNNAAVIASVYELKEVTQGDLVSIPYLVYDPTKITCNIDLTVYAQVAGELIEIDKSSVSVGRDLQYWNTRKYPAGIAVFSISYTYTLYGVETTVTKSHTIKVNELEVDVTPDEDSLQLYLTAQGRSNNEQNPAVWTFTQAPNGDKTYAPITTTFTGFNWKSNGWFVDANGDTCLRFNGDARAVINFKPFSKDFKLDGKTIEFEFVVRDVNDRDAIVIDCFDGYRGFRATPDTAFLKSSGTEVSCRYKDEERVRIAITVEHSETTSRFVSIYLDGILSGVHRYATTDIFSQDNPLNISLGSSLCGLDLYTVRVYDKALSTPSVLTNYIADQTVPTTRLQLLTDNDILDENGKVSYERVKALGQIPIITFTGPMPTYKGDKKKKTTRMKFEDPAHPEMNFDVLMDQIDVQGTSSQFYIRKNWKVKLPEKRAHIPGAIPAKVFCIKVDYAEATGTHNTGAANYVETLYDREEVTLPPQKDDTRVRTTIQGFPIIIFEKETEDSEPVFSSKGNFNYDKDAENAFGFTEDYKDFGVECWEFCNNTSDPVNFAGEIPAEWLEDFEPRYVPESANFERIEELQEIAELAASGKGVITEAQKSELATLMHNCIANFKAMHDWVLSTATYTLNEGKKVPIVPTPLASPITYGETTYTEDNEEYRLAKFKYEFEDYFNMHYSSMYYVFTFFALMTDQRAKNMFLTRWKDSDGAHRWYPYFYDNDTIFGINNEGALVFDYFHEDTDQLGSSNVFNGQNSVLWNNFRLCFPKEIEDTYSELRSSGKLTYAKIIDQFVTQGSDKWSAAIYNADADYKYVSMAREEVEHKDEDGNVVTGLDASNLYQVRGPGEHHLRYFISNRLNYCDSKWYAGSYPSDDIFLRIYTPKAADDATQAEIDRINASLSVVPANPNITLTPFSDMYAGVRYKSGALQQKRLKAGEAYTFKPLNENETFGDTETAIYGAGELSSLGDLSGLYCGVINLSNARKLTELTVGNADPAYYNDNFREISVGSNRLLKYIDLRNCSGLGIAGENPQKTLELSGCPNIEHIYTEGTNLASVDLPENGYIKTLHLPASLNTLVVRNQKNITDFYIESYANIRTLCVENSTLDTSAILDACKDANGKYTVERVRLTDITWGTATNPMPNADFIKSLFPRFDAEGNLVGGVRGIDEKNNPLAEAYLVGTCHIAKLTGAEYTEIKNHYPYLDIKYGEMTSDIIFMSADGETELYRETITGRNSVMSDCVDPVLSNKIAKPTKESNAEFDYEWRGWTRVLDGGIHADALTNLAGDRVLYPAFEAIRRNYTITFINPTAPEGSQVLAEIVTPYGSDADYAGAGYEVPKKLDAASPELYAFTGWYPTPTSITGALTCYAQFTILDSTWYTIGVADISDCTDYNGVVFDGYTLNDSNNTMAITECNNNYNAAVRIPAAMTFGGKNYTVIGLGGFSGHDRLELLNLPNTIVELLSSAFAECRNLNEIHLPESLQIINTRALQTCTKLKELTIPAKVHTIQDAAIAECKNITKLVVADGNTNFEVKQDCLIDKRNKKLLQGLTTGTIPTDGSVTSLGQYCFANMPITFMQVPDGIEVIANNAFSHCEQLREIKLPKTLKVLEATCFAWCYSLPKIELPEGLTDIMTYVFNSCIFEEVEIPASVNLILDHAFGDMVNLKKVTFKKDVHADGSIKIPNVNCGAFAGSGSPENPIVFNVPWSEIQHHYFFQGLDENGLEKDPTFGAAYYTFNFDYEEEN